jgi:hypothetical protein
MPRSLRRLVEDFFASGDDFEDALDEAVRRTTSARALDFLIDLRKSWEQWGMRCRLSENQYDYLCRLADIDPT